MNHRYKSNTLLVNFINKIEKSNTDEIKYMYKTLLQHALIRLTVLQGTQFKTLKKDCI